ncbi:MAG: GNAT family N-acetyltransferase [Saprospiraceae bacterium]
MKAIQLAINSSVYLGAYQDSDKINLIKHLNDPEISHNSLTIPYPYTPEDANWWLNLVSEKEKQFGQPNNWAIRHQTDGLIGAIGVFFHGGVQNNYDELGYWIAKPYRGQGLMTDVVSKFTKWQFESRPQLNRMEAWVFDYNPASMRVLEKSGYQKEGMARNRLIKNGNLVNMAFFGCIRANLQ